MKKKTKRVVYNVECANNPEHIFEKVYEIEEGTEMKTTEMDIYCPMCDDYVRITVQGKVVPDAELMRKFREMEK